jgi:hypothetical protein
MEFPILENQICRQYKLFAHEGFWTQLHAQEPKENRLVSRELVKGEDSVVQWARQFNGKGNLYLGRAARDAQGTPIRVGVFTLDVDPVRAKGTASSAELHGKAIATGRHIQHSVGGGYLCSSGNGALLVVPLDRAIAEDLPRWAEKCKQFESQLRDAFQTPEVTIDATQDAARLCRLLGTWNVKGAQEHWRPARFLTNASFQTNRPRIRETISSLPTPVYGSGSNLGGGTPYLETKTMPVSAQLPTYDHSVYPTREKAEFAFALRLKLAGFGPEDIRQQLGSYGYIQNPRDAQRVIEKLFASGPTVPGGPTSFQRSNGVAGGQGVANGGEMLRAPEPLWTPASGTVSADTAVDGETVGTGFRFLDQKLGGFRSGYVYAIEAPTNVGKSTYITQVANHLSRSGRRVLLVTTESDIKEAVQRIKAIETGIPAHSLDTNRLTGDQLRRVDEFTTRFKKYPLFIRYTTNPGQVAIDRDIQESKAEVVLWDYYQHFETGTENRQVQLASLARWFESTALKYQIPFIVAAQLHRRVDFKTNKVLPSTMDQIKDCKVLNDAAKVVITLDWQHGENQTEDGPVPVVMNIAKNKGPMCSGVVRLVRNIPRFEEL